MQLVMSILIMTALPLLAMAAPFDHTHADLNEILKEIVIYDGDKSDVNYKKLQKMPIQMNRYLKVMGRVSQKEYGTFSEKQKIAFWLNAYNGFALKLIIDNYPVNSIKKIATGKKDPLDMKYIRLFGKYMSLNEIEKEYLNGEFDEPRVYFAMNPGTEGAPRLRNEVYLADTLDQQLTDQMQTFLHDSSKNRVDHEQKKIWLSPVFKNIQEDIKSKAGSLAAYVLPHLPSPTVAAPKDSEKKEQAAISPETYAVEFSAPDWALNEIKE